jgi:hypothetical protein
LLIEFSKKMGLNLVSLSATANKQLLKEILSYSNIPKKIAKLCVFALLYPIMQGNKDGDVSILLFRKNS